MLDTNISYRGFRILNVFTYSSGKGFVVNRDGKIMKYTLSRIAYESSSSNTCLHELWDILYRKDKERLTMWMLANG